MVNNIWSRYWFKLAAAVVLLVAVAYAGIEAYVQWKFYPSKSYDTLAPQLPEFTWEKRILLFSKTNGFRHLEGIPAATVLVQSIAERNNWDLFVTENAAVHNDAMLREFDLVIWASVSGDVLLEDQRAAFKHFIEGGGVVLALHGSGGDPSYDWQWHPQEFIRAQFIGHPMFPQFRDATITIEDKEHPSTMHLPEKWLWNEEWYSFEQSPRPRVNVLASVDEKEYGVDEDLAMGDDHPLIWYHKIGDGTVYYTALGHQAKSYQEPAYKTLLEEAMKWLTSQSMGAK